MSGQVGSDDENSDNRTNSAKVLMNLPTRDELGNSLINQHSITFGKHKHTFIKATFHLISLFGLILLNHNVLYFWRVNNDSR